MRRFFWAFCSILWASISLNSQNDIRLLNPSFEFDRFNRAAKSPMFWMDFGKQTESPTDLQPGQFGCQTAPFDGHSFVGMVTRDNGTTEAIGQKMEAPMRAGGRYRVEMQLARSPSYHSISRLTSEEVNFEAPVILRILGLKNQSTDPPEILATSEPVASKKWDTHRFEFQIGDFDLNWIVFQAYCPTGQPAANGNILIDHVSGIERVVGPDDLPHPEIGPILGETDILLPNSGFENLDFVGSQYEGWEFVQRNAPIPESCGNHDRLPDSNRHLALTTSGDEEFAKVMARLERPMKKGRTYQMGLQASHCQPEKKPLRIAGKRIGAGDLEGCFLRVFGVNLETGKMELLASAGPVTEAGWAKINLELCPKNSDLQAIVLEAWNDQGKTGRGIRHIFIDDLSAISLKN